MAQNNANVANKSNAVKSNSSELFTLANQLRKSDGLTQKEAFAKAKAMLTKTSVKDTLTKMMASSVVYIKFKNRKGKEEVAKATNCPKELPKRKIGGAKTPKNDNWITFYDKIHGMYRSVTLDAIIEYK